MVTCYTKSHSHFDWEINISSFYQKSDSSRSSIDGTRFLHGRQYLRKCVTDYAVIYSKLAHLNVSIKETGNWVDIKVNSVSHMSHTGSVPRSTSEVGGPIWVSKRLIVTKSFTVAIWTPIHPHPHPHPKLNSTSSGHTFWEDFGKSGKSWAKGLSCHLNNILYILSLFFLNIFFDILIVSFIFNLCFCPAELAFTLLIFYIFIVMHQRTRAKIPCMWKPTWQ